MNPSAENWNTPPEWISRVRAVFGGSIGLDPASNATGQEVVRAAHYFTEAEDALRSEWPDVDTAYMNPPYGAAKMRAFVNRLFVELDAGRVRNAIVLANAVTETEYGQRMMARASRVFFPKGRIRFLAEDGKPGDSPRYANMFLLFGRRFAERFDRVFGAVPGVVLSGDTEERRADVLPITVREIDGSRPVDVWRERPVPCRSPGERSPATP